jgi:serine/threonine protein kinase
MEIYVKGNRIVLNQNQFVAKGGEAMIFKRGSVAYKIYEDLTKMIPTAKIKELEAVDHPQILRPKELILNNKKQNIGFTMDWLGDKVIALCKLFTSTYRQQHNIENDMTIELVENIKELIQFIHSKNCLLVDGNELNYLVQDNYIIPYIIDVNAWKTPSYNATAIMPSVRDWTTAEFNVLTDWFSFAVVTFQLFIGIHPFKGRHQKYRKNDFANRVKNCISVFNPQVSLPPTVRDFGLIPGAYKDWYYKMFELGVREPPPTAPGYTEKVQVTVKLVQSTNSFEITTILEVDEDILYHNPELNITKTKNKLFMGKTPYKVSMGVEVLFTPLEQLPILVKIENYLIDFRVLKAGYQHKPISLSATDLMIVDNHLYLRNNDKLIEMDFRVGTSVLPVVKTVWNIEPLSSTLFSSVIYQSVLGKAYICIPIPNKSGNSSFYIKGVPEINDFKIIEAKYQNHVCMLIGHNKNEYHRVVLVFDKTFSKYICRITSGIDYAPLNFIVLDNGVCVSITEDDAIEMFMNRVDKSDIKRIEDPDVDNTMRLCKDGTIVKFWKGNKVYSMRMKKGI